MAKNLKKTFIVCLVICMCLGVMGMQALADGTQALDFTAATTDLSGEGWSWANGTKTLTLSGATIDSSADATPASAITLPDGAKIVVSGENTIVGGIKNGIASQGTLTIEGDGKLNIRGYYGIYAYSETGDAKVSLSGVTGSITGSYAGIYVQGECADSEAAVVIENCDLDVTSTATSWNNRARKSGITVYVGSAEKVETSITINNSVVNATGFDAGLSINNYVGDSDATNSASSRINITNSTVVANGTNGTWAGIFASVLGQHEDADSIITITDSTVYAVSPNTGILTSSQAGESKIILDNSILGASGKTALSMIEETAQAQVAELNNGSTYVQMTPDAVMKGAISVFDGKTIIATAGSGITYDAVNNYFVIPQGSAVTESFTDGTTNDYTFNRQAGGIGGFDYAKEEIWGYDVKYKVTYEYTGTVPAGAPELPAAEYYFPGDLVSIEADENYAVTNHIFSGWQDPCNYLSNGIMPAHDVTLTGYYVPVNANVDPPIGIKTDKETTGNDYEVKIEVPGDGDAVKIHDEVILIIDGSYSMDEEWEDMKANIVEIGKKVLGGAGRTRMTVISFGMDDNIVVEGIKTVAELKAMLPELPGGLLYGRSSTNCEVGFTGALNYIQSKQDELAKVDVIFISDGGVNTDETPRAFDTNWQKFSTKFGAATVAVETLYGALTYGDNLPEAYSEIFGSMTSDAALADTSKHAAFVDEVWADVYAYSELTPGKEYPISVVERAFVKYDKEKGTYIQDAFYYSTYNSKYVTYGDMYNRSVAAAEDLAASSLVDELYLLQYANHSRGWWVKDIEDGKNYYKAENVAGLLDNVGPMLTELSNTNYKDVVITDYMSKWVLLHTDSIRIVNDTTGKTIWSIKDGWAADAEKPTTAEPPVTVEKVDPANYAAGGEDVIGNTNGDIYKITWYVKDDCLLRTDNYSLRYTVTVDVEEEGLEVGKEYPANGNTYVEYKDGNDKTVKHDIDVPDVTVPAYTVTYINGKAVLQETDGHMTGDDITDYEGDTPTKAQTGNTAYRFTGWKLIEGTPDGDKIGTTDLVYEAQYKKIILNGDDYVNIPDDDIPLAPVPEVFTDDHYAYIVGYPDGSVQPGGQITRAEVATIFFRLLTEEVRQANMVSENDFSDVNPGNWFNNAVSTMAAMGIVNGYPDGSFRPNAPITRAEFAAIASRFDANASEEGDWFSDISGHWAEKAIIKAVNNGWIKGYDDGTFRPNQNITRAEAMTLVNRVLHRLPGSPADLLDDMIKWPDNADTEAWYYLAVQEATNSHHYSRETEESEFETWLEMREARDWTELEY